MQDWKVRQELYHRLNKTHPDEYSPDDIQMMVDTQDETIAEVVCNYLSGWVPEKVVYPAKSYFVAYVYARLLWDHFGAKPDDTLNDPKLLYGNDPYFQTFDEQPKIYGMIFDAFGWEFDMTLGEIPDVEAYFREEFMLDQDL